jgi:hypothetical protein
MAHRESEPERFGVGWRPLLLAALLTGVVALYNHFPLAYPDTGNYLDNAIDLLHLKRPWFFFRLLTYGAFLVPFATRATIWFVPLAQGVLVAVSIDLALRTAGVRLSGRGFVWLLAALSSLTSLSWFSGQVMPDVFTPLVILLSFVVLWTPPHGASRGLWTASGLLVLGIASHLSHFPLYVALVAAGIIARLMQDRDARAWRPVLVLGARGMGPLLAALAIVVGSNYLLHGQAVLSRSSYIFALGHLVGDGVVQRYLDRACPSQGDALCADRANLRADTDWFLWDPDGPRARSEPAMARGDSAFLREAPLIVTGTLRQEWPAVLQSSLRATAIQLVTFGLHPGEHAYSASVASSMQRLGPGIRAAYVGSRQASGALPTGAVSRLHYAVVCSSVLALLITLPTLREPANHAFLALVGMVLVGLMANAAILASLSTVHPRYQSRVVWLVPLLGAVAALQSLERRRTAAKRSAV